MDPPLYDEKRLSIETPLLTQHSDSDPARGFSLSRPNSNSNNKTETTYGSTADTNVPVCDNDDPSSSQLIHRSASMDSVDRTAIDKRSYEEHSAYICERSAIHRLTLWSGFALLIVALVDLKFTYKKAISWEDMVIVWAVFRALDSMELMASTYYCFPPLESSHLLASPPKARLQLVLGRLAIMLLNVMSCVLFYSHIKFGLPDQVIVCVYPYINSAILWVSLDVHVASRCDFPIPHTNGYIFVLCSYTTILFAMHFDGYQIGWNSTCYLIFLTIFAFIVEEVASVIPTLWKRASAQNSEGSPRVIAYAKVIVTESCWTIFYLCCFWWLTSLTRWLEKGESVIPFHRLAIVAYVTLSFFFCSFLFQTVFFSMIQPRFGEFLRIKFHFRRRLPGLYFRPRYLVKHERFYQRGSSALSAKMLVDWILQRSQVPKGGHAFPELDVEKDETCTICRVQPCDGVIMECGHSECCYRCAQTIFLTNRKCHLCRNPSNFFHRISLVPQDESKTVYHVIE